MKAGYDGGAFSEAWCTADDCGWRVQGPSRREIEDAALAHEPSDPAHRVEGQDVRLWKVEDRE